MTAFSDLLKQVRDGTVTRFEWGRRKGYPGSYLDEMTREDVKLLTNAVKASKTLEGLILKDCIPGADDAQPLMEAIGKKLTLAELNLEGNYLGDENMGFLAPLLEKNKALTDLNLEANAIGDAGIKSLAQTLKGNSSLAALKLKDNHIGLRGLSALAKALQKNRTLTELDLRDNNLGSTDMGPLLKGQKNNPNMISFKPETIASVKLCAANKAAAVRLFNKAQKTPGKLTLLDIEEIKNRIPAFIRVAEMDPGLKKEEIAKVLLGVRERAASLGVSVILPPHYAERGVIFTKDLAALTEVFKPEKWVGRIGEMLKEWDKTPGHLKEKFNFAATLNETRQKTLKKDLPKKPVLESKRPKPPKAA